VTPHRNTPLGLIVNVLRLMANTLDDWSTDDTTADEHMALKGAATKLLDVSFNLANLDALREETERKMTERLKARPGATAIRVRAGQRITLTADADTVVVDPGGELITNGFRVAHLVRP